MALIPCYECSREISDKAPAVYTSVLDAGVLLTIRYLCRPRQRRGTAEEFWERILDTFAESPDIEFAYPTQRVLLDGPE
jgi:hypothetical protein